MESPLTRMGRRVAGVIQQEMSNWMDDLLKESFNPDVMLRFIRGLGIDLSQLPGMVGQQPGFDPYVILHLDRSASDEEVKQVYRKMMSKIHPDKAGPELTTVAALVNAAYELIKKERKWK